METRKQKRNEQLTIEKRLDSNGAVPTVSDGHKFKRVSYTYIVPLYITIIPFEFFVLVVILMFTGTKLNSAFNYTADGLIVLRRC